MPRIGGWAAGGVAGAVLLLPTAAGAQTIDELRQMTIDQLGGVKVSSVGKIAQPLSRAPAAIYVITHDDIVRSGRMTLPEILRLAPNLQVYRTTAGHYVITARGLNGNAAAQSYANKLLVMIDGRSVYTPLFSGVYWDMQDVLPRDIERIEVISGPGATMWGANAVNGVVNIITRKAADTRGGLVDARVGGRARTGAFRYGAAISDRLAWRAYVRGVEQDQSETAAGDPAHDAFHRIQGGFRLDWMPDARNAVTVQGDAYGGSNQQLGAGNEDIAGADLAARWAHRAANGATLQLQAYYDHAERRTRQGGGHFGVDTFDLDLQHSLALGDGNALVWGGGLRASRYHIHGTRTLLFDPARGTLTLANLFAQDTLSLTGRLDLTAGLKLEDDPYVGATLLPDARIAWRATDELMLWGAVSRAVRAPTPFDEDVAEYQGSTLFVTGSRAFRSEKLTAFELGLRMQPAGNLSLSVSGFYNLYDDLRSVEIDPATLLPLHWGNRLTGHSYGIEAWGDYRPTGWWTLSAGVSWLGEHFHARPGTPQLLGPEQNGDDPDQQATLRSSMNLGGGVTIDADFREVGALPDPRVPAYAELDGRIGWALGRHLLLSVSGSNLLHAHHVEYATGYRVSRQVVAGVQWGF